MAGIPADMEKHQDTVDKVNAKMEKSGLSITEACAKLGLHKSRYYNSRMMLGKSTLRKVKVVDHGAVAAAPAAKKPSRPVLTGQRMALVYGSPAEVAEFYRQMARG